LAGLAQENMIAPPLALPRNGPPRPARHQHHAFRAPVRYDEAAATTSISLLTLVDCQITYRSRYLVGPLLARCADLSARSLQSRSSHFRFPR